MGGDVFYRVQRFVTLYFKKDKDTVLDFTSHFTSFYAIFLDIDFEHLAEGLYNQSPLLTEHPKSTLQHLGQVAQKCSEDTIKDFNLESLDLMAEILKCLVIICS
ncbi:unnamed protein product [Lymnaea stagnalis]|uniref:Uncharacterized protein n=1 Tax=Lymnaea stagnalis TaxID=6523 RepID=A0AAV2HI03_LYMST